MGYHIRKVPFAREARKMLEPDALDRSAILPSIGNGLFCAVDTALRTPAQAVDVATATTRDPRPDPRTAPVIPCRRIQAHCSLCSILYLVKLPSRLSGGEMGLLRPRYVLCLLASAPATRVRPLCL